MSDWIELQSKIYHEEIAHLKDAFQYPLPLANFVGRKEILKVLAQKLTPTEDGVPTAALCGLGGMGKSELASYFAYKKKKSFSLIYWMQCDSEATLINSYLSLARHLQLSLDDTSSLDIIRKQVHEALEERTLWLLVFDNAANSFPLPKKGGSILITSQRQDLWRAEDVVKIPPLSPKEGAELVQKITQQEDTASIQKLVEKLEEIPLALSHAAVSIKSQGITVKKYLKGRSFFEENPLGGIWKLTQIKQENPEAFTELIIEQY
jgi:hypothetical protein